MPNDHSLVKSDDPKHPANLIPELCRLFYTLGWVTGTGGGISIRDGDHVFIAPSALARLRAAYVDAGAGEVIQKQTFCVQKERIQPEDIFVLLRSTREHLRAPEKPLKQSACTPLFFNAYDHRDAGACIHTHSQHAVMVTLLWPGKEFKISHQEMIKGMRIAGTGSALSYLDTLTIPIIENTPDEEDLRFDMETALIEYPNAPAVLVRRHGTYSWGKDTFTAKGQAECLDYLLEIAVKMRLAGMKTEGLES